MKQAHKGRSRGRLSITVNRLHPFRRIKTKGRFRVCCHVAHTLETIYIEGIIPVVARQNAAAFSGKGQAAGGSQAVGKVMVPEQLRFKENIHVFLRLGF
ncbi:hypothetical protein D3C71_1903530 [compost metagenome]